MKKHIPNLLTCLNLFCGSVAVVMIFRNHLEWAAYLVIAAAIFDLFDGIAARLLSVQSTFGKELDSLADVISFGLIPGLVLFKMLQVNVHEISANGLLVSAVQFLPFVVTAFSALRLAKFNLDTRQAHSFIGLPTPANTLFIVSLPLILLHDEFGLRNILLNPWFILGISFLQSYLLISELPFIALKFRTLSWKENSFQFILVLSSAILLILLKYAALPLIIFLYVLLSLIKSGLEKKN